MLARMMALTVWLLVGGSVAYWGLQLLARPLPMPASALPAGQGGAAQVGLSRLLGSVAEAPAEPAALTSSRLRLLGVVAPRSARAAAAGEGVALIEVDGVARTVRVGASVDGELRLLRVDARSASLGLAGQAGQAASQVLQLEAPAEAATGSLQAAVPSPLVLGGNPPGTQLQAPAPQQADAPPATGLPLTSSARAGSSRDAR